MKADPGQNFCSDENRIIRLSAAFSIVVLVNVYLELNLVRFLISKNQMCKIRSVLEPETTTFSHVILIHFAGQKPPGSHRCFHAREASILPVCKS